MSTEFKNWLRQQMATAEITQKTLADAIGCTQTTVSQWLAGRNDPSAIYLARIAKYFAVDPRGTFGEMFEWMSDEMVTADGTMSLERRAVVDQINRDLPKLDDVVLRMLKDQIRHVFLAHSDELMLLRKRGRQKKNSE